jgi:hypothetical protein
LCGSHYGVDIVVDRAKNLASSTPLNRLRELGFSSVLPPRTEAGFLGTNPTLRDILASGHLSDLRWPDFPDYKIHLTEFYEPTAYGFCRVHDVTSCHVICLPAKAKQTVSSVSFVRRVP